MGAGGVEAAAGLPVRLGGIPPDVAGEAGGLGNQFGQFTDADLATRPEVDWVRSVIALGGGHEAGGGVGDVQELARR